MTLSMAHLATPMIIQAVGTAVALLAFCVELILAKKKKPERTPRHRQVSTNGNSIALIRPGDGHRQKLHGRREQRLEAKQATTGYIIGVGSNKSGSEQKRKRSKQDFRLPRITPKQEVTQPTPKPTKVLQWPIYRIPCKTEETHRREFQKTHGRELQDARRQGILVHADAHHSREEDRRLHQRRDKSPHWKVPMLQETLRLREVVEQGRWRRLAGGRSEDAEACYNPPQGLEERPLQEHDCKRGGADADGKSSSGLERGKMDRDEETLPRGQHGQRHAAYIDGTYLSSNHNTVNPHTIRRNDTRRGAVIAALRTPTRSSSPTPTALLAEPRRQYSSRNPPRPERREDGSPRKGEKRKKEK